MYAQGHTSRQVPSSPFPAPSILHFSQDSPRLPWPPLLQTSVYPSPTRPPRCSQEPALQDTSLQRPPHLLLSAVHKRPQTLQYILSGFSFWGVTTHHHKVQTPGSSLFLSPITHTQDRFRPNCESSSLPLPSPTGTQGLQLCPQPQSYLPIILLPLASSKSPNPVPTPHFIVPHCPQSKL